MIIIPQLSNRPFKKIEVQGRNIIARYWLCGVFLFEGSSLPCIMMIRWCQKVFPIVGIFQCNLNMVEVFCIQLYWMKTELGELFIFKKGSLKSSLVFNCETVCNNCWSIIDRSLARGGGLLLLAGLPKKFTNTLFGVFSLTYLQQGYQTFTKENQECLSSFESIYIKANLIL